LLAFYPWAVRRLHVPPGTRLLLSSDAAVIKGLRKPPGCLHVCYCHSPPRYLWEMSGEYLQRTAGLGPAGRQIFRRVIPGLREWDRVAAAEVDVFVANSQFVAGRIRRCYGREATVIYPPVDAGRFAPVGDPGDAYLVVAELVAYKRVDLAVAVCTHTHRRLVVVGVGPELARLRRLAGSTVEFAGRKSEAEVAGLMARCRALLHPQIEDFGIAAVEAQAAGRPVIAYRGGGALETVVEGTTGLFFEAQEEAALAAALDVFESAPPRFASEACARQARRFAPEVFRSELSRLLSALPAP
jgi:glycosyltransferase involved in cell wall biosynthesis